MLYRVSNSGTRQRLFPECLKGGALGKGESFLKKTRTISDFFNLSFAECQICGTRQKGKFFSFKYGCFFLKKKENSLPSAISTALDKEFSFFKKNNRT